MHACVHDMHARVAAQRADSATSSRAGSDLSCLCPLDASSSKQASSRLDNNDNGSACVRADAVGETGALGSSVARKKERKTRGRMEERRNRCCALRGRERHWILRRTKRCVSVVVCGGGKAQQHQPQAMRCGAVDSTGKKTTSASVMAIGTQGGRIAIITDRCNFSLLPACWLLCAHAASLLGLHNNVRAWLSTMQRSSIPGSKYCPRN
jgi:hypothetical protein